MDFSRWGHIVFKKANVHIFCLYIDGCLMSCTRNVSVYISFVYQNIYPLVSNFRWIDLYISDFSFHSRMTFEDYCKYFVQTCICRVVNTSYFSITKTWHEGLAHGQWKNPDRAGGCPNNRDTFVKNPQVWRHPVFILIYLQAGFNWLLGVTICRK